MPIVELTSFGPFREARLKWFPGQTVMIVGANGLGKSMLVLALQQLLTGTHYLSEDAEAENLVHYGQEGYRLVWQDEHFEIVESRENDSPRCEFWQDGKLYEGRPNGSKGNRVSEHRQAIDDLFGLSGLTRKQTAEIFLRRVLISPETNSLFNMRDAELTNYLLAAFGIEGVKERRREIMDEKNKLKNELDGVQKIKAPELKIEDETVLQAEIDRLKKLTNGINPPSMLPKMQSELVRLQQNQSGQFAEREAMLIEYEKILNQYADISTISLDKILSEVGNLREPRLIDFKLKDAWKRYNSIVNNFKQQYAKDELRLCELIIASVETNPFANESRDAVCFELSNIKAELTGLEDKQEPVRCPICGAGIHCKSCDSTFRISFGYLKKFSNNEDLTGLKLEAKILEDKLKAIDEKSEYNRLQDKLLTARKDTDFRLEEIKTEISDLEYELVESEKLSDTWADLKAVRIFQETKQKYSELKIEVDAEKDNLQQQINRLEESIIYTEEAKSFFEQLESLNEQLITSKANRAALVEYAKNKEQVDKLEAEILDYERVIKDLPIFMRQQISQKSGLLAHRANLILNQIGGKGDIRFNPGDDEEIKKIVIEQQQYGVWNKIRTGGSSYSEQRLIAFSLLLAQHELYDTFFKPVDLVIQDDIFAGVDANRQELLARGVKNVSKSTQIILTSYDVEQWVNPDQLYRLVKNGDSTILEEE